MKVTAILKGHIDINGHQPIQIRISDKGKQRFVPTHIKVEPRLFTEGRVKSSHPKAKLYNERIATMILQCQAQNVEGLQKKTPKVNFYEYVERVISGLTRKPGSLRQYQSQLTKLKEFNPSFYLSEVNHDFLDRYQAFLKTRGNDGNTIWSSFKFLRKFIRQAHKTRLIDSYPFDNYEFPKYVEPDKVWLTENDLSKIDNLLQLDISPRLKEAGNWFLIACHTGLRISDIKRFDYKKHVINGRLVMRTQKGGRHVGLDLKEHFPEVLELLERVEFKRLSMHENTYNELIKMVAAAADVDKHISSHTARHTAAMSLANKGVSQEVVAQILGHTDLRSTRTYFKITNQRIDLELSRVKIRKNT